MNKLINSGVVLSAIMLSGCGQPGPLYLPKDQPTVYSEPAPVAEPDGAKDGPKEEAGPNPADSPATNQAPQ